MIQIPLEIGDTILAGRFKNKKIKVNEIDVDEYGNPTVNGRSILKIRIPKLYQQQENEMKSRNVYLQEKNGKYFVISEVDKVPVINKYGYNTKQHAQSSAVFKGYNLVENKNIKEGKAVFVKDKNIPSVLKDSGLSFTEYKKYEDSLLSKKLPELRKLQGLVSKQQDKLRKDNPDPNKWPEHIKRADKQLRFRDMMLMAAVDHVAFKENKNIKEGNLNEVESTDQLIKYVVDTYRDTKKPMSLSGKREANQYEKIAQSTDMVRVHSRGNNDYSVYLSDAGKKKYGFSESTIKEKKIEIKLEGMIRKILGKKKL